MSPSGEKARQDAAPDGSLVLGRVSGPHGVNGWVKLYSYTEPRQAILDYGDCLLRYKGTERQVELREGRVQGKGVIAHFAGIDDRDAAVALIDHEVLISRSAMPALSDGHFYWAELEGLAVLHKNGTELGQVAYLLATGSNDVLVVQGEKETLVPFLWGSVVLEVDLEAGTIQVDWEWE